MVTAGPPGNWQVRYINPTCSRIKRKQRGRAATGREQPREKRSDFNEVTTNKANKND